MRGEEVARAEGFEPPTGGSEVRCSIQLSYARVCVHDTSVMPFKGNKGSMRGTRAELAYWLGRVPALPRLAYGRARHNRVADGAQRL